MEGVGRCRWAGGGVRRMDKVGNRPVTRGNNVALSTGDKGAR